MDKLAYSIPEVVQVSSLGRSTIYEAISDGSLRSARIGTRRIVLAEDLTAWLRSQRVEGGSIDSTALR